MGKTVHTYIYIYIHVPQSFKLSIDRFTTPVKHGKAIPNPHSLFLCYFTCGSSSKRSGL